MGRTRIIAEQQRTVAIAKKLFAMTKLQIKKFVGCIGDIACCNRIIVTVRSKLFSNTKPRDDGRIPSIRPYRLTVGVKILSKSTLTLIDHSTDIDLIAQSPLKVHQTRIVIGLEAAIATRLNI